MDERTRQIGCNARERGYPVTSGAKSAAVMERQEEGDNDKRHEKARTLCATFTQSGLRPHAGEATWLSC